MKLYRIKKSNIDRNGRGLYVTKDIKEGTRIIDYVGKIITKKKSDESEEKYNERHQRWRELCESSYNAAEIIIAKQRHGPIGNIKAHFDSNFTKFSDLSSRDYVNVNWW